MKNSKKLFHTLKSNTKVVRDNTIKPEDLFPLWSLIKAAEEVKWQHITHQSFTYINQIHTYYTKNNNK